MSSQFLRAIVIAALLAFTLSVSAPAPAAPPAVLAGACGTTASG